MRIFRTSSEEETIAAGGEIARELTAPALVLLIGQLGAGKTTLAKGIASGLGAAAPDEVSSPTFTLIHEYGSDPAVYHIDLYRLDEERELVTLGLEELLERRAFVLVEWGERFPRVWPKRRVEIHLTATPDGGREIRVERVGEGRSS